MSEPRRWWVRIQNYDGNPVKRDRDRLCCDYEPEPQKLEAFVEVIEAEPVLARIKELETQLKEANEVAEFYGGTDCYAVVTADGQVDGFSEEEPGKRARAYLKKWEGK